jgi:hypothetical protein
MTARIARSTLRAVTCETSPAAKYRVFARITSPSAAVNP